MLIIGVLKKVLARNGVTGVVLKAFNPYKWDIGILFVK